MTPEISQTQTESATEPETILVVDDNGPNRRLFEAMLSTAAYKVVLAEDGAEAIAVFREQSPELVLLDLLMPGMDGFETFRRLRELPQGKETPIIIVTALTDLANVQRAIELSPDDFLAKPVHRVELLARVRALLDGRARRLEIPPPVAPVNDEDRRREQLSALIVHDLKHPLSAIYFNTGMLLRENLTGVGQIRVERILHSCETLNLMISGLLDVDRGEKGGIPLVVSEFDPAKLIEEVVSSVCARAELQRKRVKVRIEGESRPLKADREILRRLLENLVDNSAKYAPDGTTIEIETWTRGGLIQFRVRDEGPGIPPESRERIFEKYAQLDRDATLRGRSSQGLGLVFCRLAVEAHKGRVWVEDNHPKGSCFCVELPVA
jgi:signal transduction histidine kinase